MSVPTAMGSTVPPPWSDSAGWDRPQCYSTIQCADIDGDGRAELLAKSAAGITAWKFDVQSALWSQLATIAALSDAAGWDQAQYYATIQCADIDGDGQSELL